jgi:hypothetical protein
MGKDGEYYELEKGEIEFNTVDSVAEDGEPLRYRMSGKTMILTPTPDYTNTTEDTPQQAKLRVFFSRIPVKIETSDTTKEPGIPTTFHHLLALDTCYQFASAKQMNVKNDLINEIQTEEKKLDIHIEKMNNNMNQILEVEEVNSV